MLIHLPSCGLHIVPAFVLSLTEEAFRTLVRNKRPYAQELDATLQAIICLALTKLQLLGCQRPQAVGCDVFLAHSRGHDKRYLLWVVSNASPWSKFSSSRSSTSYTQFRASSGSSPSSPSEPTNSESESHLLHHVRFVKYQEIRNQIHLSSQRTLMDARTLRPSLCPFSTIFCPVSHTEYWVKRRTSHLNLSLVFTG